MRNSFIGLLLTFLLFVAACATDDGFVDPCETNNTGNLTIVNVTSGVDGISMDIYINGIFTGATLPPGGQHFEPDLAVGSYEIEGREPNGIVSIFKTANLLQCDELVIELNR